MAYPTAPPPTWMPSPYRSDPTDVMGRRIGAYLLGLLFGTIIVLALTAAIIFGAVRPWTRHTTFGDAKSICSLYDSENHAGKACVSVGDNEYYIVSTGPIVGTFFAVYAGWFIIDAVIIEGLAGGKIGKLLLGLRVVRPDGQLVGVPRALLRNLLLLIPDQIIAGLVGLITALVTRGHKRVGDMVAGTYVVDRDMVGHEIVIDGAPSGQYTSPPSSYGAQPTQTGAGTWGTPQQTGAGTWGTPQQPGAGTWGTPQQPEAGTPGTPPHAAQPRHAGAITWGSPQQPQSPSDQPMPQWPEKPSTQPEPQTSEPAAPRREPVWDAARNTYLWWDDDKREWMEHDQQSGQWRPLSR